MDSVCSCRREGKIFFPMERKKNKMRASNKTRENDQSFAVWPMGGSGGGEDATRNERGEKTRGGEIGRTEDTERSWGTRFELNE